MGTLCKKWYGGLLYFGAPCRAARLRAVDRADVVRSVPSYPMGPAGPGPRPQASGVPKQPMR